MITESINGLLSQKPTSPAPVAGQIKSFTWQEKTSQKSGKPWIKIKNDDAEHGGVPCKILNAEQTTFVDAHGNLSYNVEFEPQMAAVQTTAMPVRANQYAQPSHSDDRSARIERQHSQEMALRYMAMMGETTGTPEAVKMWTDYFENDISDSVKLRKETRPPIAEQGPIAPAKPGDGEEVPW